MSRKVYNFFWTLSVVASTLFICLQQNTPVSEKIFWVIFLNFISIQLFLLNIDVYIQRKINSILYKRLDELDKIVGETNDMYIGLLIDKHNFDRHFSEQDKDEYIFYDSIPVWNLRKDIKDNFYEQRSLVDKEVIRMTNLVLAVLADRGVISVNRSSMIPGGF